MQGAVPTAYLDKDAALLVDADLQTWARPPSWLPWEELRSRSSKVPGATKLSHRSGTLTNGILVLICVNASVHHSTKQVVQDGCQGLGVEHPMQSADKHRPAGVQSLRWAPDKVAVSQDPGDHLHLETTQRCVSPGREPERDRLSCREARARQWGHGCTAQAQVHRRSAATSPQPQLGVTQSIVPSGENKWNSSRSSWRASTGLWFQQRSHREHNVLGTGRTPRPKETSWKDGGWGRSRPR